MSIFEYNEEEHMKCLRQEGFEDGYDKGYDKGAAIKLISLVQLKMQKGMSPTEIAELLEEPLTGIEVICELLQREEDNEKIYEELQKRMKNENKIS